MGFQSERCEGQLQQSGHDFRTGGRQGIRRCGLRHSCKDQSFNDTTDSQNKSSQASPESKTRRGSGQPLLSRCFKGEELSSAIKTL
jgi:hypothetical protein